MKGSSYSLRVMKNAKQFSKPTATLTPMEPLEGSRNKQGPPPHPYVPRSASGRPLAGKGPTSRGHVKHTKGKGKKGKKGKKDQYDLIVNIDLDEWQLSNDQVAEFKEVFMLFDKDEDGVLTFPELNVVMKSLGQRPSEKELLKMVRDVSEDQIYDTIEFNEFLQMMSKQQRFGLNEDSLKEAFRIFDKDDDGYISVEELRHIMQSLGEKMSDKELDEMVSEADSDRDGLINYEEFVLVLCNDGKSTGTKKKRRGKKSGANRAGAASAGPMINKENGLLTTSTSAQHLDNSSSGRSAATAGSVNNNNNSVNDNDKSLKKAKAKKTSSSSSSSGGVTMGAAGGAGAGAAAAGAAIRSPVNTNHEVRVIIESKSMHSIQSRDSNGNEKSK